jgi:hypothetical protein
MLGAPTLLRQARPMTDLADVLSQGLGHHRAGRLEQAEACYRKILAADPANATDLLVCLLESTSVCDLALERFLTS